MPDHKQAADALALGRLGGRMLIGGQWRAPEGRPRLATSDPTTGEPLCEIACGGADDIDAAVGAARAAVSGEWGKMSPGRRQALLAKLASLSEEKEKELAQIEALDIGTPIAVGRRLTTKAAARTLGYYASWCDKIYGEVIPTPSSQPIFDYTLREPVGVVAVILPWNTPLLMIGSKVGAALACGNAVVIKPSEVAPLSVLRWAELCAEAGLPPGAVNLVTGDGSAGELLAGHPGVDLVSFTGGSQTGPKVARAAAGKPLTLELGGKSAAIVFADADLDKAAMAVGLGVFGLTGQACAASSRLLVEDAIHDEFVARVANVAKLVAVGDPLDPATMVGPLVSCQQAERVAGCVGGAVEEGAQLLAGGQRHGGPSGKGSFFTPTVLAGVRPEMRVAREEIFGPVLAVMRFSGEDEAVTIANDTRYGLAAGVFTRDVTRVHRLARQLQAGTVWVNGYGQLPSQAPFGGVKGSGYGREGGKDGLASFTTVKNVLIEL